MGLWKFSEAVPFEELKKLAEGFAKDENYEHIYIRHTSKDEVGIGFTYHYDGKSSTYENWFRETKKVFAEKFGHQFKGWDISSQPYFFKGFEALEE